MREDWRNTGRLAAAVAIFAGCVLVFDAFGCDEDDPPTFSDDTVLITITMTNNSSGNIHILLPGENPTPQLPPPEGNFLAPGVSRTRQREVEDGDQIVFRAIQSGVEQATKACEVDASFQSRLATVTWDGSALTCVNF